MTSQSALECLNRGFSAASDVNYVECDVISEQKSYPGLGLLLCTVLVVMPLMAQAEEQSSSQPANDWFTRNFRVLLFSELQEPTLSSQNPDNAFLRLPRYSAELQLQADFAVDNPMVSWTFKPRITATAEWWRDGMPAGDRDREARFYVNEWMVQPKLTDDLFVSFGKEKLLWGASFLVSPSNILFKDTEKANPKVEVEGKYMARVVSMPSRNVTITGIDETQREESAFGAPLRPIRALKVDVMGNSSQVSVIGYSQQHERFRLGSYGQWTASDAVVLYYDGIVSKGTDVLYPVLDPANPLGGSMDPVNEQSSRPVATVTAGGSYTFLSGETASFELLYNGAGYDDGEARNYYTLRQHAAAGFLGNGPLAGLSAMTLTETLNPEMPFLRRYYAMAQVQEREIRNVLDVAVRYVRSLEENAGQAAMIVEWQATKRLQVFTIDTVAIGGRETEFRSIIGKSFLAGVEMHF